VEAFLHTLEAEGNAPQSQTQRNWGQNPEPDYPWGVTYYGDKGTLKLSVWSYDYIPKGKDGGSPVKVKAVEEREKYPEDVQHKETELFAAPAIIANAGEKTRLFVGPAWKEEGTRRPPKPDGIVTQTSQCAYRRLVSRCVRTSALARSWPLSIHAHPSKFTT